MASDNGRYRGLLVDYGGVLTSSLLDAFEAFCEREGLAPGTVAKRLRADPDCRELMVALEIGHIEEQVFESRMAAILGVQAPGLIDRMFAGSRPEEAMIEAVRAARAEGVRTGLISNSWGTRRYDRAQLAELFDGVVISGEVGIRKPAAAMYVMGAERIGVPPQQCVFVDDLPFNLEPAARLGMATVHHRSAQRTIAELQRLLGVRLAPRPRV